MSQPEPVEVNGRGYAYPTASVVVVCIDGSEPDYHMRAIDTGRMPFLESVLRAGTNLTADCAMPSFTNPTTSPSPPVSHRRSTASAATISSTASAAWT